MNTYWNKFSDQQQVTKKEIDEEEKSPAEETGRAKRFSTQKRQEAQSEN